MLKDRLSKALAENPELSQADLARACKIKPPSVSDWFSGATQTLKGANLLNASACLGVSPQWLAAGKGPMRPTNAKELFSVADVEVAEGPVDATIAREARDLPEAQKEAVLALVRSMKAPTPTPAIARSLIEDLGDTSNGARDEHHRVPKPGNRRSA